MNEARTLDTQLNVFETFDPELPESCRSCEYVFLANIDPDLQLRVLEQTRAPKLVAMDTMNFWIDGPKLPSLLRVLEQVDVLFVNDGEARSLSGESNIVKAARRIQSMGPKRVAIKRGEYGALIFDDDDIFFAPAFPVEEVRDPTGAGDSFAGGFMGYLAQSGDPRRAAFRQAAIVGSTMASYTVERFSLDRLRELNPDLIQARVQQFRALTDFPPIGF
jgi:sugar/nucleoside kinase (ribokinase family)